MKCREASAEVGQLLRCAVAARTRTALAGTYVHDFGGRRYRLRLFKAVTGQTSGHHKDGCLTGHEQARLTVTKFDRSYSL